MRTGAAPAPVMLTNSNTRVVWLIFGNDSRRAQPIAGGIRIYTGTISNEYFDSLHAEINEQLTGTS